MGGRSPLGMTVADDESEGPRREYDEPPEFDEPSERVVPLFSHVSGGPETCTGFATARPTVPA